MRNHRSIVLPWRKHGPGSRKSAASIDVAEAHGLFWHCSKRCLASVIIRCQCCSTSRSISCLRFGPSRVGYQPERSIVSRSMARALASISLSCSAVTICPFRITIWTDGSPPRLHAIFNAAEYLSSDDEFWPDLVAAAEQAYGAERAAEILPPEG
jgi:hypothetical protein